MKLSDLMALSEASTGYVGGSFVDQFPYMNLEECAERLPVAITESQMELFSLNQINNDIMVESAVSALHYGTSIDYDSLTEGAFDSIKTHVKNFFDKLIKFLKSIIEKIKILIDRMFKSGKQLVEKYKDSSALSKDFSKMPNVSGYKFPGGTKIFPKVGAYANNVKDLINGMIGEKVFSSLKDYVATTIMHNGLSEAEEKEKRKDLSKFDNQEKSERVFTGIKMLTGSSKIHKDSWKSDLISEMYGTKSDLSYGRDFTEDNVIAGIESVESINDIKDEYQKVLNAVIEDKKEVESTISDAESYEIPAGDAAADGRRGKSIGIAFLNKYLAVYEDAQTAINSVLSFKLKYEKDRAAQYKRIFGKMLSYTPKKSSNSNYSDSEDDFYGFDF